MDAVRMDKWLWAARFFKTRALAVKACEIGRIRSNDITAKAARDVKAGDKLHIRNEGGEFTVEVLEVSDTRGPAAVAQAMYRETEESRAARAKAAEERKALQQTMGFSGMVTEGRPSKRDRRLIHSFTGKG